MGTDCCADAQPRDLPVLAAAGQVRLTTVLLSLDLAPRNRARALATLTGRPTGRGGGGGGGGDADAYIIARETGFRDPQGIYYDFYYRRRRILHDSGAGAPGDCVSANA